MLLPCLVFCGVSRLAAELSRLAPASGCTVSKLFRRCRHSTICCTCRRMARYLLLSRRRSTTSKNAVLSLPAALRACTQLQCQQPCPVCMGTAFASSETGCSKMLLPRGNPSQGLCVLAAASDSSSCHCCQAIIPSAAACCCGQGCADAVDAHAPAACHVLTGRRSAATGSF